MPLLPQPHLVPVVHKRNPKESVYRFSDRIAIDSGHTVGIPHAIKETAESLYKEALDNLAYYVAKLPPLHKKLEDLYYQINPKLPAARQAPSPLHAAINNLCLNIDPSDLSEKTVESLVKQYLLPLQPQPATLWDRASGKHKRANKRFIQECTATIQSAFSDINLDDKLKANALSHLYSVFFSEKLLNTKERTQEFSFPAQLQKRLHLLKEGKMQRQIFREIYRDLKINPVTFIDQALAETHGPNVQQTEINNSRLMLEALGVIAARENLPISPELLMNQEKANEHYNTRFFCSQPVLLRVNFEELNPLSIQKKSSLALGDESSGKYKFFFGFASNYRGKNSAHHRYGEADFTTPLFLSDNLMFEEAEQGGVSPEKMKDFFQGFLKMADMADHDYLHTILLPFTDQRGFGFDSTGYHPFVSNLERHAASLHAQVMAELFQRHPQRKLAVIKRAKQDIALIAQMQQTMLAHGQTENAYQLATCLTEIYCHRLFRIISPHDKDLDSLRQDLAQIQIRRRDNLKTADFLFNCPLLGSKGYTEIHKNVSRNLMYAPELKTPFSQKQCTNIQAVGFILDKELEDPKHGEAGAIYKEMANAYDKGNKAQLKESRRRLHNLSATHNAAR